jgi:hypothetical protein
MELNCKDFHQVFIASLQSSFLPLQPVCVTSPLVCSQFLSSLVLTLPTLLPFFTAEASLAFLDSFLQLPKLSASPQSLKAFSLAPQLLPAVS